MNQNNLPKHINPDFLDRMKSMLGEEYPDFLSHYGKNFPKSIRFNSKKISKKILEKFSASLKNPLEKIEWDDLGFTYCGETSDLTDHPYYYAGLYYLQESSAMAPVNYMGLKKGMKVLDLCAAPGGKTLQIAQSIGDGGLLLSNDLSVSRQRATVRNIEKFGFKNVIVSAEPPEKLATRFQGFFDAILVDAPCSGEGIFLKDSKYALDWSKSHPVEYAERQLGILSDIKPALKEGGRIMYSTCTFSREENEGVIENFLSENQDFEIIPIDTSLSVETEGFLAGTNRFWPHRVKGLGHFFALLGKGGELHSCKNAFYKELIYSGKRYISQDLGSRGEGIRILRSGLLLGDAGPHKNHPSQALAMSMKPDEHFASVLNFNLGDDNIYRYLRGETLVLKSAPGLTLICVDSLPLGWGKSNGNKMKNLYKRDWIKR